MAERMLLVPVSLIERLRDTYVGRDYEAADAAVSALLALLSQPTPTAGACICTFGPDTDGPNIDCPIHGQWPIITDMAPGTTLIARPAGEDTQEARFRVAPAGRLTIEGWRLTGLTIDDLDPSTIRDVTPPGGDAGG